MASFSGLVLQRHFYGSDWKFLPIFRRTEKQHSYQIIGFLSRQRLEQWLSDLERCQAQCLEIPPHLMITDQVPQELLLMVSQGANPPILLSDGEILPADQTEKVAANLLRVLLAFRSQLLRKDLAAHADAGADTHTLAHHGAHLQAHNNGQGRGAGNERGDGSRTGTGTGNEAKDWLGQSVLAAIPRPMLAVNLQGKTLFYNEYFSEDILVRKIFQNSLFRAEKLLFEIFQDTLVQQLETLETPASATSMTSAAAQENPSVANREMAVQSEPMITYCTELAATILISSLYSEAGEKYGLLFFFQSEKSIEEQEFHRIVSRPLDLASHLEKIEKRFIAHIWRENRYNVTRTAAHLGLRRSTLQHKLKNLSLLKVPHNSKSNSKSDSKSNSEHNSEHNSKSENQARNEAASAKSAILSRLPEAAKSSKSSKSSKSAKPAKPAKTAKSAKSAKTAQLSKLPKNSRVERKKSLSI